MNEHNKLVRELSDIAQMLVTELQDRRFLYTAASSYGGVVYREVPELIQRLQIIELYNDRLAEKIEEIKDNLEPITVTGNVFVKNEDA